MKVATVMNGSVLKDNACVVKDCSPSNVNTCGSPRIYCNYLCFKLGNPLSTYSVFNVPVIIINIQPNFTHGLSLVCHSCRMLEQTTDVSDPTHESSDVHLVAGNDAYFTMTCVEH
jgi:hypothetical protein